MVGIAVIGAGYWGKNHIRNYKALLQEKIIEDLKICDTNEERAREIGKDFNSEINLMTFVYKKKRFCLGFLKIVIINLYFLTVLYNIPIISLYYL